MNFFEALDKVSKEKAEEIKKNETVQEKTEKGDELFRMEKPKLDLEQKDEKSFTSYTKEELDEKFSELLAKIENVVKTEEKGEGGE